MTLAALPLLLAGAAGCGVQQGRSAAADEEQTALEAEADTSADGATEEDAEGTDESEEADGSGQPEKKGTHYGSAEELVQAYRDAGGQHCDQPSPSTELDYASSAVSCGDDVMLSVYDDRRDRINQVTAAVDGSAEDNDDVWLMGMTWIIQAPDAEQLQDRLGGKVVDFSELKGHHSRGERHSRGEHRSQEHHPSR